MGTDIISLKNAKTQQNTTNRTELILNLKYYLRNEMLFLVKLVNKNKKDKVIISNKNK
jgi:hypothetical protein